MYELLLQNSSRWEGECLEFLMFMLLYTNGYMVCFEVCFIHALYHQGHPCCVMRLIEIPGKKSNFIFFCVSEEYCFRNIINLIYFLTYWRLVYDLSSCQGGGPVCSKSVFVCPAYLRTCWSIVISMLASAYYQVHGSMHSASGSHWPDSQIFDVTNQILSLRLTAEEQFLCLLINVCPLIDIWALEKDKSEGYRQTVVIWH